MTKRSTWVAAVPMQFIGTAGLSGRQRPAVRKALTAATSAFVFSLALASMASPFQASLKVGPNEILPSRSAIARDQVVGTVAKARLEIAHNPQSARAYVLLGAALRAGGNLEAANRALDRAVTLDPQLSGAWLEKGLLALENGRSATIAEAEGFFRKAVSTDPSSAGARLELATIFLRQGDFTKARAQLEATLRQHPQDAGAYDGLGFIDLTEGNPQGAAKRFRQALALRSPFPEAEENLGMALLDLGDAAGARAAFEKALAGQLPDTSMATYGLARALKRLGERSAADAAFAQARDLMRNTVVRDRARDENYRGLELWHRGDLAEAEKAFRHSIAVDPAYAEAHNNLGISLWQAGEQQAAQQEFAQAVRDDPGFAKAHNNLGNVLLAGGETGAAIAQFRAALASQPGLASAHLHLAVALIKEGNTSEATNQLHTALELDPSLAVAHLEMGLLLIKVSGHLTSAARREFEEGLRLNPQLWSAIPVAVYEALVLEH